MLIKQTMASIIDNYVAEMVQRSSADPQIASRAIVKWMQEAGIIDDQMSLEQKEQIVKEHLTTLMSQKLHDLLAEEQQIGPAGMTADIDLEDNEPQDAAYPIQVTPPTKKNDHEIFDNDNMGK